jgi:hypothetical protein
MVSAVRGPLLDPISHSNTPITSVSRPSSSSAPLKVPTNAAKSDTTSMGGPVEAQTSSSVHSAPISSNNATQPSSSDALRYTITEVKLAVKEEITESSNGANIDSIVTTTSEEVSSSVQAINSNGSHNNQASSEVQVAVTGQPVLKQDVEEDPESSDVSDEEEVDTSAWTNSLMSLYEEPVRISYYCLRAA